MGKTAAELRALMGACPSMMVIHVGEKTTVVSDVNRNDETNVNDEKPKDIE